MKGLGDSLSKIRSAVVCNLLSCLIIVLLTKAYAISTIAQYDWPENWPDLFDQLMVRLSSGFVDLVHGTMRVLTEFCQEISDTQIPHVAPVILPHLIVVIKSPQVYLYSFVCNRLLHFSCTVLILEVELLIYLEIYLNSFIACLILCL